MQFTPQFFYEHASRTADVSHGRIHKAHHEAVIIPTGAPPRRSQEARVAPHVRGLWSVLSGAVSYWASTSPIRHPSLRFKMVSFALCEAAFHHSAVQKHQ